MNLDSKSRKTLEAIRMNEESFAERLRAGSKNPMDYHYCSYFSGLANGFKLAWALLDGMDEKEYDELVKKILESEEVAN